MGVQRLAPRPRQRRREDWPPAQVVAGVIVAGIAVATRFVGLRDAPAEWYGDISTLYEYVEAVRNGDFPDGYYVLGVGPLYPLVLRPVLAVLGTCPTTSPST